MSEERIIDDLMKRIRRIDKTVNKVMPFMSLVIFIVAVIAQIIRETNYPFREPQQFCLLPLVFVPNLVMCIGVLRKNKLRHYLLFSLIWQALSWILIVISEDYIMPTYLYGLRHAEIILAACFLGSVTNAVAFIVKWKPFMKVSLLFNIVVYIAIIIYAAITQPALSQFQNEIIYYALGFIFFYISIAFNIGNISFKDDIEFLNDDLDDFPELYKTDGPLIDPIQTLYEVYMLRNLYEQRLGSGIDYNIFYKGITEEGRYLDYMLEHNLYGKEFIDKMVDDFLKFKSMCSEGLDDTSEKLRDFFKALKDIQECTVQEEKDRKTYCLFMMMRADRRYFKKEE